MIKYYGFVVLNYNNFEDTVKCVNSLLSLESTNFEIVLVDNFSTDDSFNRLRLKYAKNSVITCIQSGKNGGFSYGNNCGIKYLLKKGIDNVIIATSDTIVISKDILAQLDNINIADVGVIGPKIISSGDTYQNPVATKISLLYIANLYFYSVLETVRRFLYWLFPWITVKRQARKNRDKSKRFEEYVFMVHGAFFYLTPEYFKYFSGLCEKTFMYGEEDLLSYLCITKQLKLLFVPQIEVFHKDQGSVISNLKEKALEFRKSNLYKSKKKLLKSMRARILFKFWFKTRLISKKNIG